MSKTRLLWLTVATTVVVALMTGWRVFAADGTRGGSELAPDEFAGRIVSIRTAKRQFTLENVKVIQVGGQFFLSGMGVKNDNDMWWAGVPVQVNLASVEYYSPMTPGQLERALGKPADAQ